MVDLCPSCAVRHASGPSAFAMEWERQEREDRAELDTGWAFFGGEPVFVLPERRWTHRQRCARLAVSAAALLVGAALSVSPVRSHHTTYHERGEAGIAPPAAAAIP